MEKSNKITNKTITKIILNIILISLIIPMLIALHYNNRNSTNLDLIIICFLGLCIVNINNKKIMALLLVASFTPIYECIYLVIRDYPDRLGIVFIAIPLVFFEYSRIFNLAWITSQTLCVISLLTNKKKEGKIKANLQNNS